VNVDDELRRMLDDLGDRLDVPVRFDATEVILAGAKRLRRRRIAAATASGVVAVVLLAGIGILLARPGPESAPPAVTWNAPPPTTSSSPSASLLPPRSRVHPSTNEPPEGTATGGVLGPGIDGGPAGGDKPPPPSPERPPVTGVQLGPDGFGSVRLGMSYEELVATGALSESEPPPPSGCATYEFTDPVGSGQVQITSVGGVQAIRPATGTHTVDGVSSGWTLAQVRVLYPEVTPEFVAAQNPVPVEVRGNPGVVYMITFADEVVSEISLRYADQFCA
jgi:hypothetical protein